MELAWSEEEVANPTGCLNCLGPPSSGAFEGAFRATSVLELAAELADSRAEGKTRSGVRPQLGQAAVVHAFLWCSVAALSRSSREAETGARLASRGRGWRVPLLAASGDGLVAVVVMFPIFEVPAALAGQGLVIPTGPSSRSSPPLLSSARGSSSRELGVRQDAEAAVAPCVVRNSESECCELLYLMGGDLNFGVPGEGPGGRVVIVEFPYLQMKCKSNDITAFPVLRSTSSRQIHVERRLEQSQSPKSSSKPATESSPAEQSNLHCSA
ncbi:hypothetical protein Taro_032063 [Colocasia esculenta]|uniref:Uncharacterized protein n=1 Tax=Colocasia esculenta TaxID=4460 RepID=A0A843VY93_COLES|nr:hypothetical protein [Colocasia esculenta]